MKKIIVSPQQGERPWLKRFCSWVSRTVLCIFFVTIGISCIAAGPYPEHLSNKKEIRVAKPALTSIDIRNLPLEDYPLLSKFTNLKNIYMTSWGNSFVTDEKLKALADIGFTNLTYIGLNNCQLVTDKGITALSKIQSLKELSLEGTAITDAACIQMASPMSLTMIVVANCDGITKMGLSALAKSASLQEISFSADKLTQDEVLALLDSFRNVTWCEIIDPKNKLDSNAIKAKGAEKKIHVTLRPTGALQDMRLKP